MTRLWGSCWSVAQHFFFSADITGRWHIFKQHSNDITCRWHKFKPHGKWNIVRQFCSELFFSFLMISQVGGINSNNLVSKTLSDSSARNVFFFISNDITGRWYKFKPHGKWNIVRQFCSERFFSFLMISQVGYIHSNHADSEPLSDSSAQNVFFSFLMILQVGVIN